MAGRDGGQGGNGRLASANAELVPVGNLLLDVDNPRLSSGQNAAIQQDDVARILWNEMAVDEVALSIAANGYFPEEPLIVIPADPRQGDGKKKKGA